VGGAEEQAKVAFPGSTWNRVRVPGRNLFVLENITDEGWIAQPRAKQGADRLTKRTDQTRPEWRGWHACRRGLASNPNRLGIDDSVIQCILRHSSIQVTQGHYIKTSTPDVLAAMEKIERELVAKTAAQALTDSQRTLNRASGAQPEIVN